MAENLARPWPSHKALEARSVSGTRRLLGLGARQIVQTLRAQNARESSARFGRRGSSAMSRGARGPSAVSNMFRLHN